MEANELQCALEAVLFAAGEPVAVDKLCQVLEVPEQVLHEAAQALAGEYDYSRRGIKLVRLEDRYQLCSRADYAPWVRRTLETRRAPTLSAAALEVLAIAAYRQPVTRVYIEQVRGVDCAAVIHNLVEKELLEEKGRLDVPGRPLLYGTTANFLRVFDLESLSELPELPEIQQPKEAAPSAPVQVGEQPALEFSEGAAPRADGWPEGAGQVEV